MVLILLWRTESGARVVILQQAVITGFFETHREAFHPRTLPLTTISCRYVPAAKAERHG